jgi:hypothetical protein
MLSLQRRRLSREEDLAFRTLRNLPFRLSWDLQTLGSTPGLGAAEWDEIRACLQAGNRNGVLAESEDYRDQVAVLHVRAVLSLNEVAWQSAHLGRADDEALSRYIAWWASLMSRKDWLRNFAVLRCRTWGAGIPESTDQVQFLDRAEKSVGALLQAGAGAEDERLNMWLAAMDQERATIDAIGKACGGRREPPAWPSGYGPLGLQILGKEADARAWISSHALTAAGDSLPLSALKANQIGFYQLDPDRVAIASRAIQYLFSELGPVASTIWHGQPRKALERLGAANLESRKPGPWFCIAGRGRRSRDEGIQVLRVEALLLQFQDELARPEVAAESACETAARILTSAAALLQPRVAVRQVEALLCGRLAWCGLGERLPDPREVERILSVAIEIHSSLNGRGEGKQCALEIAKLLNHRAVATWNRAQEKRRGFRFGEPESILRDMFHAVQLAPHSHEIVGNLAGLALQFPSSSPAERVSLLNKVLDVVNICMSIGKPTPQMEEYHDKLLEIANPEKARRITLEKIRKAIDGNSSSRS